uniref:Uncharacterized protein n=1 Tax=Anguilla anguilla TaxID=7936 RepID=A0A0E9UJE1_ANGAN
MQLYVECFLKLGLIFIFLSIVLQGVTDIRIQIAHI